MDTKTEDIGQFGQEQLGKLLTALAEDTKKLEKQIGPFFQHLQANVNDIQPVVSTPSKEEYASVAKQFRESFEKLMERHDLEYLSLLDQLQRIVNVYGHVWRRYDAVIEETPKAERMFVEFERALRGPRSDDAQGLLDKFVVDYQRQRAVLLQTGLQKLVEGQDEELKRWFWKQEMSGFGGHVRPASSTRPDVKLSSSGGDGRSVEIPADIMGLIFAATDIATCVELREVSKDWHSAFNDSEGVMERKLRERNPWIKPGDSDLQSWADCLLVFVRRLQSGKWSTTTAKDMPKIKVPALPVKRMTVVGEELELDEKLPSNFSGIFDKPDQLSVRTRWHGTEYHIDPWTRRSRKAYISHTVLREDEQGTVISFEGTEITLDPSIRADDIQNEMIVLLTGCASLQLGRQIIQVMLNNDRTFVAPRDKPHFEHGMIILPDEDAVSPITELGDVLVFRQKLGHQYYSYSLLDIASTQIALVSERCMPVASYNGLVWCFVGGSLVPTFVDLKTPDTTYYRTDLAIAGSINPSSSFRQCSKSQGLGQFVLNEPEDSTVVVDLATGVLTTLQEPPGWSNYTTIIPGFLDGEFQMRCMKRSVLNVIREKVLRDHGVEETEI